MGKFKELSPYVQHLCMSSSKSSKVHFILQDYKAGARDKALITMITLCSVILINTNQDLILAVL